MQEEVKDAEKKFLVDYIISHRDGYKGNRNCYNNEKLL